MICQRYGVIPSTYLGFDRLVSESSSFVFDSTVARFGQWVHARANEMTGGKRSQQKYKSMQEVLGIDQEELREGETGARKDMARMYLDDLVRAQQQGMPLPNPEDYVEEEDGDGWGSEKEEEW